MSKSEDLNKKHDGLRLDVAQSENDFFDALRLYRLSLSGLLRVEAEIQDIAYSEGESEQDGYGYLVNEVIYNDASSSNGALGRPNLCEAVKRSEALTLLKRWSRKC